MNLGDNSCLSLSQLAMNFHAKTQELKNFFFVKQLRHKLRPSRQELHQFVGTFSGFSKGTLIGGIIGAFLGGCILGALISLLCAFKIYGSLFLDCLSIYLCSSSQGNKNRPQNQETLAANPG